jgi:hypothetical protein
MCIRDSQRVVLRDAEQLTKPVGSNEVHLVKN